MSSVPGPEEQLATLAGAQSRLSGLDRRERRRLAWFCTGIALLIGAAHVIPSVFRPNEDLRAFLVAMGVFVVAVLAVTLWYRRSRTATPRGGGRRYLVGFAATMGLYVAALFVMGQLSWPLAVVVGVVIAAPLTVAGWWRR